MEGDVILVVSLSGEVSASGPEMAEYRARMQPLLLKYGAERVSSARVLESPGDDPREIHLTRFPDKATFDALRADPDYLALEDLRQVAMAHVRTYVADEYVTFLD
jgi:uncharacterized protein (DUF1330 family)